MNKEITSFRIIQIIPNYHTTKHFSENLLAIEMKKIKVKMNKPIYLDMSILDISKTQILV